MADHERYMELISAGVDGALSAQEEKSLKAHLAKCPQCAAYQKDIAFLQEKMGTLAQPLPEGLHEKIMRQVTDEGQSTVVQYVHKKRRRPPVFTMVAAAAIALVLVGTGTMGMLLGGGMTSTAVTADAAATEAYSDDAAVGEGFAVESEADSGGENTMLARGAVDAEDAAEAESAGTADFNAANAVPSAAEDVGAAEEKRAWARAGSASADAAADSTPQSTAAVLPESLAGGEYAFCYEAAGTSDIPSFGGTLLLEENGFTYYAVDNNLNVIQKMLETLEQAGFDITLQPSTGDSAAKSGLVIVRTQE